MRRAEQGPRLSNPTRHVAALAAALVGGCAPLDNPYLPYPEPDFGEFVADVQPVVEESCASLGCHGNDQRQLSLYAVDYMRATQSAGAPIDVERLGDDELFWNYDALRMRLLDETDAEQSYLLLKCLDPELGGIRHDGGMVVFSSREDPGFLALWAWIEGGL